MEYFNSGGRLISYPPWQDERELAEKKQGQYNTMEKRGSDLQKEVKILQEALADYNTVLDKVSVDKVTIT